MDLEQICRLTLRANFPSFRNADITVSYYPYIGLTHTIRRRGNGWVLRISDHCRHAPAVVLEAVALILGCKVMRRRPPQEAVRTYRQFLNEPSIQRGVAERRLRRGRKRLAGAQGKTYALQDMFRELNERYFNNQIEVRGLGWGLRRGWSRLGHYDSLHQTITLSPVLDSPRVPQSTVAYILYHEMLHSLFNGTVVSGKRNHHPPEFQRAERGFPGYAEARNFLRRFCRTRGRF
jgi:hypothetical protein